MMPFHLAKTNINSLPSVEMTHVHEIFMPIWNHWCEYFTGFSLPRTIWWMLVVTNVQMDGLHCKACGPASIFNCLHVQGLEKCLKRLDTWDYLCFLVLLGLALYDRQTKPIFFPFTLKTGILNAIIMSGPICFCNTWLRSWFLLSSAGRYQLSKLHDIIPATTISYAISSPLLHWTSGTGITAERQKQVQIN